jgi:electron transport complex protein RnfG
VAAETPLLGIRESRQGYRVRQGNTVIGVILPATARDGYSGDIRALVGVRRDGSVAGVRVVAHRETPGLGDKVDLRKSDWVLDFNERSLANPALNGWNVEKAGGVFDQFTGATVTPRAVILATRRALEYATLNAAILFETEADSA